MIDELCGAICARLEGLTDASGKKIYAKVERYATDATTLKNLPVAAVYLASDEAYPPRGTGKPVQRRTLTWHIGILVGALPAAKGQPQAGDIIDRTRDAFYGWQPASAGMAATEAPDVRFVDQNSEMKLLYLLELDTKIYPTTFKLSEG